MAGKSLTTAAQLKCPHGGTVTIVSANQRVKAAAPLALATDTFTVAGCPNQIPGSPPVPNPCVTVKWVVADMRNKVGGQLTLSESSVGICLSAAQIPLGKVQVVSTQAKVKTR
jgi:hypothetical protein